MTMHGSSTVASSDGAGLIDHLGLMASRFRVQTVRSVDDSLDLRYGVLAEGPGEPDCYLLLINGRSEWLEKYVYVPGDLGLPKATAVLAWDHRGQGLSGGARAFVDSYDSYASDAQRIVEVATKGKPYVVLAHSMGGLIALYATLTGRLAPRAMVLSSPLLGMPERPIPSVVARPLSRLLTIARLGPVSSGAGSFTEASFEGNQLTHHADLYERMKSETRFAIPGATFGWVSASFQAVACCFDPVRLKGLKAPTLVLSASEEKVVNASAPQSWVAMARAAGAEVQLKTVQGARHELLSEVPEYYEQALAASRAWLSPHWG